jgi:putative nucleotidyltransferase with HDIG domain
VLVESLARKDLVSLQEPLPREIPHAVWVEEFATRLKDHSPWTFEHSKRVAQVALRLGERLGLSGEDKKTLSHAGLLHDLGKIAVPNSILNKTEGTLTENERMVLDRHPRTGFDLVFPHNELAAKLIVSHHEQGERSYPRAEERGDDPKISTLKSIIRISDKVDACMSKRPYKNLWGASETKTALSGFFDPRLLDIAVGIHLDTFQTRAA